MREQRMQIVWLMAGALVMGQNPDGLEFLEHSRHLWTAAKPVVLDRVAVDVPLTSVPLAAPPGHRLFLVLRDLSTESQPGVVFRIYLRTNHQPERLVASLNFFNLAKLPGDDDGRERAGNWRSFDLTEIFANGKLPAGTRLSIRSDHAPAAKSGARIGRMDLVAVPQ
jgi:hypothetical protein